MIGNNDKASYGNNDNDSNKHDRFNYRLVKQRPSMCHTGWWTEPGAIAGLGHLHLFVHVHDEDEGVHDRKPMVPRISVTYRYWWHRPVTPIPIRVTDLWHQLLDVSQICDSNSYRCDICNSNSCTCQRSVEAKAIRITATAIRVTDIWSVYVLCTQTTCHNSVAVIRVCTQYLWTHIYI